MRALDAHPSPTNREEALAAAARLLDPLHGMTEQKQIRATTHSLLLFCAQNLQVRVKDGGALWPFVLNPIQRRYRASLRQRHVEGFREKAADRFRGIRDLIVKPRQLGFSTFIAALFFMDGFLNPGRVSVILAHDKDIAEILLETYRIFWDHLPGPMRGEMRLSSDSKYEFQIVFPGDQALFPPSKFVIDTEAGHPWRGGVIHNLHASEAAFYRDYQGFKNSYLQAVPATGNAILETTANGQNLYHADVVAALEGEGDPSMPWHVVYYAWFEHPEYRKPWDPKTQSPLTAEEAALMSLHGLDLQQIAWRRAKKIEVGSKFPQEYPETLAGAFLTTGTPFFDMEVAAARLDDLRRSPVPFTLDRTGAMIYQDPLPGETYVLSADIAEGLDRGESSVADPEQGGSDFSSGYVIHARTLRVVAALHGRIPPVEFARKLDALGRRYRACVAPERNNHGHTVVHVLEEAQYPEVYRHAEYDQGGQRFLRPGFPTDTKTRPMILDALAEVIRTGLIYCPDPRFWVETLRFHRNKLGKPEALPGSHDDRVMSLAIGVYLCTLGRSAWGLAAVAGSDRAGFPTLAPTPAPAAGPAPVDQGTLARLQAAATAPPGVHPDRVPSLAVSDGSNPVAVVAQERAILTRRTCGNCTHYRDALGGLCGLNKFRVQAIDPSCVAHYPADTGPVEDWAEGGEW